MAKQAELFKGELMEEKLRMYFLNNGYYVVRGIKYEFEGNEITDIDLFLYGRSSGLSRERINVDIKNKRIPKAFERILWTNGLQRLLGFDKCVVATSDTRETIRNYGLMHDTMVLNGNFLQKLNYEISKRISEEDLYNILSKHKSYKTYRNQSWKSLYETSKTRLINELDFSGFNSSLIHLRYFLNKCFDQQKKATALRMSYAILSHSLLILDYVLKDIAFLEPTLRQDNLKNGLKYGNLGREGVHRTIDMAVKMTGSKVSANQIKKTLETDDINILVEFFSKVETIKNVFGWAIQLEELSFNKNFINPNEISPALQGVLALFLDYFEIKRTSFFNQFNQL